MKIEKRLPKLRGSRFSVVMIDDMSKTYQKLIENYLVIEYADSFVI